VLHVELSRHGGFTGSNGQEVDRMKWIAIVLGAVTLALAVGVTALVTQRDGWSTRGILPTDALTPTGAVAPASPAKRVVPVPAAMKAVPRAPQPTRAACSDNNDPTGADCAAGRNDGQAGDSGPFENDSRN
jgi:hypothetical protein